MSDYYSIRNYKKDVQTANDIYERSVVNACIDHYGQIIPHSDEELNLIKATARGLRNQFLGAAGKRLRATAAIKLLDRLEADGWDLTATLAVNVTKALLGRAIERNKLISRYGSPDRTAGDKSKDFEKLKTIHEDPIFLNAQKHLAELLDEALRIRKKHAPSKEGKAFDIIKRSAELNR